MIIIIMGVTGSGKSTVGKLLAERLSLPFIEADHFHSKENIEKMSRGIPLTDEDRNPWLVSIAQELKVQEDRKGAVLACSALREKYRQLLQNGLKGKVTWILLQGTEETLRKRMEKRTGHFMPETLLRSQLDSLEIPSYAHCFSVELTPETIVNKITGIIDRTKNGNY